MTARHTLALAMTLSVLVPPILASKKDAEAAALIDRAKQLSSIRADGAPAFRMKVSFKSIKPDRSELEGTYTETWVSKAQWRRETVLGGFHRIQVVAGRKRWQLDNSPIVPQPLPDIGSLSEIDRQGKDGWKPRKLSEKEVKHLNVRCLDTDPDPRGARSALCFDENNGLLVAEVEPWEMGTQIKDKSCFFADYQKFADRLVARSYECDEDKRPSLEAKMVELIAEPTPDPALFAPLQGAKESVNCLGKVEAPQVARPADLMAPAHFHGKALVVVELTVGSDGKSVDPRITSPPNPDLDRRSLEAVGRTRFHPATCDGEPMPVEIGFEIGFSIP
jgi:hypothetical protein